jgi:molybdopterin-containing oxidoreductase family iron-sulfur binding subunit
MARYGMIIDLKKCIGCMACTIACKVENGTRPGIFWNMVKDQEFGTYPNVKRVFVPVQCFHCADPPCVKVCPTEASYQRPDGIVAIDYEKCIGCRYCLEACPYGARNFNEHPEGYFGKELTLSEQIVYAGHHLGVTEKCTFCLHRIQQGKLPACVQTCIGQARIFGDLEDPESEISLIIKSKPVSQLKKELKTNPAIYYLAP